MSDQRITPDFTTVAVVLCAIVGLVLVAGALPPLTGGGYAEAPEPANPASDVEFSFDDDDGETVAGGDGNSSGTSGEADGQLELLVSEVDPVPGTDLTVEVRQHGDPVEGAAILFNGETVGTTDENGRLAAEVPYVEELTVLAQTGDASSAALADAPGDQTSASAAGMNDHSLSETLETDSQFDIALGGGIYPSGQADVVVSVGGSNEAVEDATVRVNDHTERPTDSNGTASVPIPEDADTLILEVSRGELTATEEVPLSLDASVNSFPFPFAFGSASVEAATEDGHTIEDEDVTVYVLPGENEEPTTSELNAVDDNGRTDLGSSPAGVGLPVASSATIVVEAGTATDTVVVDNLLRNLGLFVLGTTSIVIGAGVTYTRILGRSPSRDVERVGWSLKLGAINLGDWFKRTETTFNPLDAFARVFHGVIGGIAAFVHALTTFRLPQLSVPSLSVPSLSVPSLSLPSLSSDDVVAGHTSDDDEDADDGGIPMGRIGEFDPADLEFSETVELTNRELIAAAWHELAETAGVEDVETTTPGAVARAARQSELPDDAIEVLTTVFRHIEYGGADATDERKTQALKALAAIRAAGGAEE